MASNAGNQLTLHTTLAVPITALAGMMLALLLAAPVRADTHTITNTLDTGQPGSLRLVVQAASPGDTIVFSPAVFSVSRTITLTQGMIVISKALAIDGTIGVGVYTPTISGGSKTRVFQIASDGSLTLRRVRIINGVCSTCNGGAINNAGQLNLISTQFISNSADWYGGSIYNSGLLTVVNSSFAGGLARIDGGAIYFIGGRKSSIVNTSFTGNTAIGDAGAIFNVGPLSITSSSLLSNSAVHGGAIYHSLDALSVISSTLNNNRASHDGGAIFSGDRFTLFNSSLAANTAMTQGGAVYIEYSTANVSNTTFSANKANDSGGAIMNWGTLNLTATQFMSNTANQGGAIYNAYSNIWATRNAFAGNRAGWGGAILNAGMLDMNNSTIASNNAITSGGGILNYYGNSAAYLVNCTLAGNGAKTGGSLYNLATMVLKNTLVATGTVGNPCAISSNKVITDGGHNLDTGNSCGFVTAAPQRSAVYVTKPRLGVLQLNPPGSTPTMMLLPDSPAIDAGDKSTCPPVDQRGVPRSGTYCDIGAYEANWKTKTFVPFIKRK